jgi:hypothetical protein
MPGSDPTPTSSSYQSHDRYEQDCGIPKVKVNHTTTGTIPRCDTAGGIVLAGRSACDLRKETRC